MNPARTFFGLFATNRNDLVRKNPKAYAAAVAWAIVFCLMLALVSSVLAGESPTDAQYVIYMGDAGVVVFKFELSIAGESPRQLFERYVDNLVASIDGNGDGMISLDEARGKYLTDRELRSAQLIPRSDPAVPESRIDVRPTAGQITRRDFEDYFRRVGLHPFLIQYFANVAPQAVNRQLRQGASVAEIPLFLRLDVNRDGKLSADELEGALRTLSKLDLDDDETISAAELNPTNIQFSIEQRQQANVSRGTMTSPFLGLGSEESISKQIRRLVEKYDTTDPIKSGISDAKVRNNKLSAKELGITQTVFARFDNDGDGQLDSDELRTFLTSPEPTICFTIAIDSSEPLQAKAIGEVLADSLRMSADGTANIKLETSQLSVVRSSSFELENVEMMIKPQFLAADANANGYLEKSESDRAFLFGASFDDVDFDKNGKVYLDEVIRYFQIRFDAARSRVVLTIHEQGRTLFEILDTDRDRRLSFRELKSAAGKLSLWDRDGDGLLSESEIPFQYRLTVSRGSLPAMGGNVLTPEMNRAGEPSERTAGPLWFRKMDKNRDGEVSKREFLGETATFEKLDQNRDGYIDLNEVFQIVNE